MRYRSGYTQLDDDFIEPFQQFDPHVFVNPDKLSRLSQKNSAPVRSSAQAE
ncbi:hypothetical protein KF913_14760 [Candidatus Obscuribacterales bacterium]|nr:hypothetical protein [Candidatus Obscuribacterales bacterium]